MLAIRTWPSQAMTMGDLADQLLLTAPRGGAADQPHDDRGRGGQVPSSTDRRAVLAEADAGRPGLGRPLAALHMGEVLRQEAAC